MRRCGPWASAQHPPVGCSPEALLPLAFCTCSAIVAGTSGASGHIQGSRQQTLRSALTWSVADKTLHGTRCLTVPEGLPPGAQGCCCGGIRRKALAPGTLGSFLPLQHRSDRTWVSPSAPALLGALWLETGVLFWETFGAVFFGLFYFPDA